MIQFTLIQKRITTGKDSVFYSKVSTSATVASAGWFYEFDFLKTGGESFILPAGNYQYPFSFQLPLGLPSSFEGDFGYVRYTIKIVVDRPWKFNYEAKAAIAVNSIYDLNTISLASVRLNFIKTHRRFRTGSVGSQTVRRKWPVAEKSQNIS
jgi:Arrestin (or S-antigen), N-terminal domain